MPPLDRVALDRASWRRFEASGFRDRARRWRDAIALRGLRAVVSWCEARRIRVDFCNVHCGVYRAGRIMISRRLSLEHQLHFLLHECGHHLIGYREPGERFGLGYGKGRGRRLVHRCDVLDEEFEAWHRGLRLARRLGLCIDGRRFNMLKARMLATYCRWVTNPDSYSLGVEDA